jgi:hypothetical protein
MATKRELIKIARKGNFDANRMGSELACNSCGCYDYEGKHEDGCLVGALLQLIEENVPEE